MMGGWEEREREREKEVDMIKIQSEIREILKDRIKILQPRIYHAQIDSILI